MTPVRIPPMLRDQVEGQREVHAEGETVRPGARGRGHALSGRTRQSVRAGRSVADYINVYVGRDDVRTLEGLDTPVGASSVILLPAMAGGG